VFRSPPGLSPAIRTWLAAAYQGLLRRAAPKLVRALELVAAADGPALVHCAAGKDRTGVVVAVLLRAVGVSRAEVIADYRRTEPALPAIAERTAELIATIDPAHRQRLMGVPAAAIAAVLDVLDGASGGAAGWLRGHGAPARVLDAWRRRLLDG
jgi:protein-tyrosine phosphatase